MAEHGRNISDVGSAEIKGFSDVNPGLCFDPNPDIMLELYI